MARHISLRVPWHDNGWKGCVCSYPSENQSCLRLKNIYENRDDKLEEECRECELCQLECAKQIPCLREGGAFMSPDGISVMVEHPYTGYGYETHKHLLPTELRLPPYSYPARPYRWTMKQRWLYTGGYTYIEDFALETGIDYHPEYEPDMKNKTWVQDGRNQKAIFDAFFEDIEADQSICIFYAKQVPFIEDNRRIVIGMGHVKNVIPSSEYESSDPAGMSSYLWETVVTHSIREDYGDGFLFPYKKLMEYAEEHEDFDISSATVFASDDFFEEFSYASEHLSYDAVIDVILQSIKAMSVIKECGIEGNWDSCIAWLNDALISVWEDRGAFPGLGAMLVAFGIPSGVAVARELKNQSEDSVDLWDMLDCMFESPESILSEFFAGQITNTLRDTWRHLPKIRKALFQMLSRVTLSTIQADVLYNKEERDRNGIYMTDEELIGNPYLLYEKTRDKIAELQISIKKVDLAFYPLRDVKNQYPIEAPTKLESDNDKRRVRAIAVSILENNALNGNTIMPVHNLVLSISDLPIEPKCSVNGDIIAAMLNFFVDEIVTEKDALGQDYFKLQRYKKIDRVIQTQVNKRISSPNRHQITVDWLERMEEEFGPVAEGDVLEQHAREEKSEALQVLAESRLSVLVGGAGTGKTTVLEFLCRENEIQNGGILLLAPTGKARVRMSQGLRGKAKFAAYTVAQFLGKSGRYDGETFTYKVLEGKDKVKAKTIAVPETVIIDESSMLTEEMFGAILDAVGKYAGRIIFVGDTNQLPPIGAGRPFVDLVRYIRSAELGSKMSGKCFARLITTRRQKQEENRQELRADIRLSKWFTETDEQLDEDIFSEIQGGVKDQTIVFRQWTDKGDLENTILETIKEVTGMESIDDIMGFNRSLGATIGEGKYSGQTYFNATGKDKKGCAAYVEKWQILAPVRNNAQGVLNMNHLIHEKYREDFLELAARDRYRKIPSKMGPEGIVYGDKVINLINTSKKKAFPESGDNYIANGEIGMACGSFGNTKALSYLHVEFASQLGKIYSYESREFGEEAQVPLELAYALTVHKAQGSQFDSVILVLSDKCFLLSKELLYTALTRQEKKLYILYNEEAFNLRKYSSMEYSDIAKRFTDLFAPPKIVEVGNHYYEEDLIHRAKDGRMFRSKSEVIIANMLIDNGLEDFLYEEKLPIGDTYKLPDFTFKDAATGSLIIWEHCGMMTDPVYRQRWENKKNLYELNGYSEENGNLIVTEDLPNGGIDTQMIQEKIDEYLL